MKLITLAVIAASAILANADTSEKTPVSQRPAVSSPADIDEALVNSFSSEKTPVSQRPALSKPVDIDEALTKTLDVADMLARNLVESLAGKSEVARLEAAGLNLLVHDADLEAVAFGRLLDETSIELSSERPEMSDLPA